VKELPGLTGGCCNCQPPLLLLLLLLLFSGHVFAGL
jgi:hypothetical protein